MNAFRNSAPRYCHICGLICEPRKTQKHSQLYATRDHLIPKSLGGGNGENLRPAHRFCNSLRGSGSIDDGFRYACKLRLLQEYGATLADLERDARVRISLCSGSRRLVKLADTWWHCWALKWRRWISTEGRKAKEEPK